MVNIQRFRLELPDRGLCLSSKPQGSIYQRLVLAGLSATLKPTCWLWNGEERGRPPTKPCLAPQVFVLLWTAATSCPRRPKNKARPCSSGSITKQGHNQHRIQLFKGRLAILEDMHLWKQAVFTNAFKLTLKVSNEVSIWRQRSIRLIVFFVRLQKEGSNRFDFHLTEFIFTSPQVLLMKDIFHFIQIGENVQSGTRIKGISKSNKAHQSTWLLWDCVCDLKGVIGGQ